MQPDDPDNKVDTPESKTVDDTDDSVAETETRPKEIGGRGGLDPTRYGDWEKAGRCIDF